MRDFREKGAGMRDQDPPQTLFSFNPLTCINIALPFAIS